MKLIALLLVLLMRQDTKPQTTYATTGTNTWKYSSLNTPTVVIHFEGDKLLEINVDGKHLLVSADGKVTGDMPHDKAAEEFWKALAVAFPEVCPKKRKAGAGQSKETER